MCAASVISLTGIGINQNGAGALASTVMVADSTMASNSTALQSAANGFIGASGNTFINNSVAHLQHQRAAISPRVTDNPAFGNTSTGRHQWIGSKKFDKGATMVLKRGSNHEKSTIQLENLWQVLCLHWRLARRVNAQSISHLGLRKLGG